MMHWPPGAERRLLEPDPQKGKERDKTTGLVHEDPQTALSFPKQRTTNKSPVSISPEKSEGSEG